MVSTKPAVFVGVPVFRGWEIVGRALEAIRNQEFGDFRALISVDGNDQRSFDACIPYADDPRFELVLHKERLGWPGNLNWLHLQAREEFFCYCHQDNQYKPSFLRALVAHLRAHPEASCVYCNVHSVGDGRIKVNTYLEIREPTAQERVLRQIAQNKSVPHNGVMRTATVRKAGPRWSEYLGAKSDPAWIVRLARQGELHRIPESLIVKHLQAESVSRSWRQYSIPQWREIALLWALNVLEGALPAFPLPDRAHLLEAIVDRLVGGQKLRGLYYDPNQDGADGHVRLVGDFLRAARERYKVVPFPELPKGKKAKSHLALRLSEGAASPVQALIIEAMLKQLVPNERTLVRLVNEPRKEARARQRARQRRVNRALQRPGPSGPARHS